MKNSALTTVEKFLFGSRWLQLPVYIGKIGIPAFGKEPYQLVEGLLEGIIPESLFYKVQDALSSKAPLRTISQKTRDELLPLRGMLKCSKCGEKMTGSRSKGRHGKLYAYYHCNHCGQDRYRAEALNETVEDILKSIKLKTEVHKLANGIARELLQGDKNQTVTKIAKLRKLIEQQEQ